MFEARSGLLARGIGFVAMALMVGTGLFLAGASPAAADETAHITGTVADDEGTGLEGIEVSVYAYDTESEVWVGFDWTYTDENGVYDIVGLPAGTFRVGFLDYTSTYLDEYWEDAASSRDRRRHRGPGVDDQ